MSIIIGLLGILEIQIHSLKRIENSYWHTLAVSQLLTITEQLHACDYDGVSWGKDCELLLPHGECKYKSDGAKVCCKNEQTKQCLEL